MVIVDKIFLLLAFNKSLIVVHWSYRSCNGFEAKYKSCKVIQWLMAVQSFFIVLTYLPQYKIGQVTQIIIPIITHKKMNKNPMCVAKNMRMIAKRNISTIQGIFWKLITFNNKYITWGLSMCQMQMKIPSGDLTLNLKTLLPFKWGCLCDLNIVFYFSCYKLIIGAYN